MQPRFLHDLQHKTSQLPKHLRAVTSDPKKTSKNTKLAGASSFSHNHSIFSNAVPSDEKSPSGETWVVLCAQAAVEQDPKRLLDLVSEINRLLHGRKKRLSDEGDCTS